MSEMYKLINLLIKTHIPFEVVEDTFFEKTTPHIYYPCAENPKCSIVCHEFSYGGKKGKLESLGLTDYFTEVPDYDEPIGWQDAEEIFEAICSDYLKGIKL